MAISSGVAPHSAWIVVNGQPILVEHGSVSQAAERKSATFRASVPMDYQDNLAIFESLDGSNQASILVESCGQTGTLITGAIDTIEFDEINRMMVADGRCASSVLHNTKSSQKWQNQKGSDIVSQIASGVGLPVNIDPSALLAGKQTVQDYVKLSDNVSLAYVIHKLSEFDGARWWVDNNGILQYKLLGNPEGSYVINYSAGPPIQSDATQLRIKRNLQAGKNVNVSVKSWHPKAKQVFVGTSNLGGSGGDLNYNFHIPNLFQDHVDQYANAKANEIGRHEYTVEATCVGDVTINVAMDLVLIGTGAFDQAYQIDSIHHSFGGNGHKMSITARGRGENGGSGQGGSGLSSGVGTGDDQTSGP